MVWKKQNMNGTLKKTEYSFTDNSIRQLKWPWLPFMLFPNENWIKFPSKAIGFHKNKSHHSDYLRVHRLSQHSSSCCDVIDKFIKCAALHLLALQVGHWIKKIEAHAALPELPEEEVLLLWPWDIWQKKIKTLANYDEYDRQMQYNNHIKVT